MKKPKIIIKKAGKKKGQCMVVIVAPNGKVLLTSEILSSTRNGLKNLYAAYEAFWFASWHIQISDKASK